MADNNVQILTAYNFFPGLKQKVSQSMREKNAWVRLEGGSYFVYCALDGSFLLSAAPNFDNGRRNSMHKIFPPRVGITDILMAWYTGEYSKSKAVQEIGLTLLEFAKGVEHKMVVSPIKVGARIVEIGRYSKVVYTVVYHNKTYVYAKTSGSDNLRQFSREDLEKRDDCWLYKSKWLPEPHAEKENILRDIVEAEQTLKRSRESLLEKQKDAEYSERNVAYQEEHLASLRKQKEELFADGGAPNVESDIKS